MTAVGRRPTLDELMLALNAIMRVEADMDALDPEKETFRVVLTFQRDRCPNDWIEGQPKPTWLFEQLFEELAAWRAQREREEYWIAKEAQFGASIDMIMAYWTEELKKVAAASVQNMLTRAQSQILSNTIMRLQELKERRAAGGVVSQTENRREKARKAWMEDEYEAPKREKEQRRQREARNNSYDAGWDEEIRRQAEDLLNRAQSNWDAMFGFHGRRKEPHRAPPTGKKPWYETLGVSATATDAEVDKAHRRLVKQFHPDRYKEADGHERMTEINTARDECRRLRGL